MHPDIVELHTPKSGNAESEYEDAYNWRLCTREGRAVIRAAISDGATESGFSRQWARALVSDFVRHEYRSPGWLFHAQKRAAQKWHSGISWDALPWYAQLKVQDGAFATLLGVEICLDDGTLEAITVGDSCLFIFRGERIRAAWPLNAPEEFGDSPILLSTNPKRNQTIRPHIHTFRRALELDDILILATDALAAMLLRAEVASAGLWQTLLSFARIQDCEQRRDSFTAWVDTMRQSSQLRNDDTTALLISFMD